MRHGVDLDFDDGRGSVVASYSGAPTVRGHVPTPSRGRPSLT